jgi:4-alpha-glucanotransferase
VPADTTLHTLARLYGIETSYVDLHKQTQRAAVESLLLAVRALGADIRSAGDAPRALQARRDELKAQAVEPVLVAWEGRLAPDVLRRTENATLVLESGAEARWPPRGALPIGYHRLIVERDGGAGEALLISAPLRANFPLSNRCWGIFAPVYALHSKRSTGAGDLADLESLVDWALGLGAGVVSTLPLLAAFLGTPLEPSPYSPASRLFWNEFYIDLSSVPEFAASLRTADKDSRPLPELVDYRRTMAARRRSLEAMSRSFFSVNKVERRREFEAFLGANPEAEDYARFRAVMDRRRRVWQQWPERLRSGSIRAGDWDEETRRYHLYVQWIVQEQLGRLARKTHQRGGLLYLDLPLGLHAGSYDAWRYPHLFVKGMSGGAPPDPVFTTGQDWAFAPMHPQAIRLDRYRYTIRYLRNHLQYARLLRLDHVMGLHRLYWIPDGLSGDKGVYVRYPAGEMYAVLSLESHRHQAGIVGENLGMVPEQVNRSMALHNIRPLYVTQYETIVNAMRVGLRRPSAGCVASLNTHDMFPFQAFLDGTDIDDRVALGFLSRGEASAERKVRARVRKALVGFKRCLEFLGKSRADVVLVNLEDLWRETKPQNIPATTKERPNWRRRMRYSMERLREDSEIENILGGLNRTRKRTGRRQ